MALLNKNKMSGDAAMASNASKKEGSWVTKLSGGKVFWVLLGVATLFALAWLWYSSNTLAVVGGERITKADYHELAPKLQKFYEFNDDKEALADLPTSVLEYLVEDKIIHQEAEKQGVRADQADIEKRYQEAVKFYGSEEKYRSAIDNLYGWTPELHKQSIERQLLQEKLEPLVVAARNGQYIAVQHLPGGGVTTMTEEQYAERAKKTAEKIKSDIDKDGFKTVFDRASDYARPNNDTDPLLVAGQNYSWIRSQQGVDQEAIDAIYGTEPGSISAITKTSTFYGIFKVDSASRGTASSWDNFVENYPHKIYADRLGSWYKSFMSVAIAQFAPDRVSAAVACDSSRCHASKVYGIVRDAITNSPMNNVTVTVFAVGGDGTPDSLVHPSCLDQPNNTNCKCGPKSITKSTGHTGVNGEYQFGRTDGTNCAVNCYWTTWKGSYSKSGYQSKTENLGNLANGGESLVNKNLFPEPASVTVLAKRTDNNNEINVYVQDITGTVANGTTPITRSKSSGFSATFEAPATATGSGGAGLVYDPAGGNNGWSNCDSGDQTQRRCGVNLANGQNKTITVWYKPVTATINDAVTCSPTSTSVTSGTPVTFTANGTPSGKSYSWSFTPTPIAVGGTGASSFQITYVSNTTVTKTVTVQYGTASASCNVTINPETTTQPTLNCVTSNGTSSITVNIGQSFTLTAQPANGATAPYQWLADSSSSNPAPPAGSSTTYTASYSTSGPKTVTVSSNGGTAVGTCYVTVSPPQGSTPSLTCATLTPNISTGGEGSFQATRSSGTGTFSWSGGDNPTSRGPTTTAQSENYSSIFNSEGSRTVTVSSPGTSNSAQCTINVTPPPPPPPPAGSNPSGDLDFDQGERSPIY